jgi:sec-independent protein translocase protein TatC
MASALDEDTRRTLAAGRATAGDMLRAAQKDLQKVFIVFLVGFLGVFYSLRLAVWPFLESVTRAQMDAATSEATSIIAQTPFDVILLQAKISLVAGVIVASPAFVWYSREALQRRGAWPSSPIPRWKLATLGVVVVGLFLVGVAYGYLVFFPFVFAFLAGNALAGSFTPTYSIVKWAEFIFLLTVSFGLAAQMPLAVTALSYTEIVPYETFRDKWRYAVLGIFVFGALFSPPDPFTQIMWAVPLLVLYGASLYLAKVVVTARRGSERMDLRGALRRHWNTILAAGVAGFGAVFLFYTRGGVASVNDLLAGLSDWRLFEAGTTLPLPPSAAAAAWGVLAGALGVVVALAYHVYREIEASAPGAPGAVGDPRGIDLAGLDAAGVRAAPPEAFATLTEERAVDLAGAAMDDGDAEKARAILDRFDEDGDADVAGPGGAGAAGPAPAGTWAVEVDSLRDAVRVGRERVDWRRRLRTRWNLPPFVGAVAFAAVYLAYRTALLPPSAAAALPSLAPVADVLGTTTATAALAAGGAVAVAAAGVSTGAYALYAAYRAGTDPAAVDLSTLDAAELRTAPVAAFVGASEREATYVADRAMAAGDDERARVVLDRYDEAHPDPDADAGADADADGAAAPDEDAAGLEDRATRAGGVLAEGLTGGETDEDDVGGYYDDVAFVLDSLTSKSFRIVGTFTAVLAVVFAWLYTGGIGRVRADFLDRLPDEVTGHPLAATATYPPWLDAGAAVESVNVVALHPVEVLIFEVKFSTLVAALAVLPMLAYYAWPALRDRSVVRGHRYVIFGWTTALVAGLFAGTYLGYTVVAPNLISWLVADALRADMIIAYRISNFFWLIFFTTAGIGLLADVPVLMVLLNTAGVSYRTMRGRWREVTVAILAVSAVFTPASIVTMFLLTVPLMAAYGVGLGALFVLTLGGRRDLAAVRAGEA